MFSMGPFDGGVKCNGHVQLPGRTTKKDRKGCKKEKIETVLKNRLITPSKAKTPVVKLTKINVKNKAAHISKPVDCVESGENNVTVEPVTNKANKPNPKDENIVQFKDLLCTSPVPPPPITPEHVEDILAATTQSPPKKTTAKKKNKNKAEKVGTGVNKKPETIDPSSVNNKNQLSCNVITIPPKRKYAKLTNWQKDCGTRHETLQRILKECEKETKLREDLYPFGEFLFQHFIISNNLVYFDVDNFTFIDLISSGTEDSSDNPLNLEFEDAPYQRFWMPSDRIEPTDRDAKIKNLRSVLRRRFHQISSLPDNSPSPDLVLAMTDAIRCNPVSLTKLMCGESSSKTKLKRLVIIHQLCNS